MSLKKHYKIWNHRSNESITLSFIIDSTQVLEWINEMTRNLQLYQTCKLLDSTSKTVICTISVNLITTNTTSMKEDEEERKKASETFKEAANELFKYAENFKDYLKVHQAYIKSLNCLPSTKSKKIQALRCNLALLSINMREFPMCIMHSDAALDIGLDSELNTKALMRRGSAEFECGISGFIQSLVDLEEAKLKKEGDVVVERQYDRVHNQVLSILEKRKMEFAEVYKVMLQSPLFKNPLLKT